ncbi:GntR family transcriptional regulator [Nonomuraea sp. PA05]|uniref:GntR family transcriptional regulator n=1 Tax=Nonomuraea sp. PA05 TaxID=2604466 RepID=UPI0011DA0BFB|nr:GntR family transcriptional regulator [Nonomuraea sp. PA05]TYB52974.1 GntR family transcriptional regulator [Nonomuraea sp. PA05]
MSEVMASPVFSGQPRSLSSRGTVVLEAIKHAILTGALPPGRQLVETELAQQLGVSKTPVREALKTLAGAGLVTMSEYKGATVRTVDDALMEWVYDLRLLLEPEAVSRTVERGADLAPAAEALRRADTAADSASDRADRSLANRDFHRALYAGCGNPLLVSTLDSLRDQTALISAAAWERVPTWEAEAEEHREILRAAQAGSAAEAAELLRAHVCGFVERVRRSGGL